MKKVPDNICEIVVVRHGQTESNRTGTLQGQLDTPLDELGILQAQAVAKRLKKWQFDAVYSSDLGRAMNTAKAIVQYHCDLQITPTAALREWDLGDLQGQKLEILRQEQPEIMRAFREEMADKVIPGGESLREFQKRVSDFLNTLPPQYSGKRVLLVSHGGTLQRIMRHCTGGIDAANVKPFCGNTGLSIFRCKDQQVWQLVTWNDQAHLEDLEQNELLAL